MNITIGNVVRGENFFDREKLIEKIWSTLETDNVLLAAPRRVGKTSIMHYLIDHPASGFKVIFLDGQNFNSPEDLVTDLIVKAGELLGDAKSIARRILSGLRENIEEIAIWKLRVHLRKDVSGRWREEGEEAIRAALTESEKVLLILDELPILLHKLVKRDDSEGRKEAIDLLDWLRYLRIQPDMNQKLRQIAGGSIGLPRVASYIGASHAINDLRQVEVGPFDRAKARILATELLASRGVTLNTHALDAFLDEIGTFLPIFIQIMASTVATEVRERNIHATPDLIRECYEHHALGSEYQICFEDYYERLDRYYSPPEARAAKRILRELALSEEPISKSTLLANYQDELGPDCNLSDFDLLLSWMRDDFYVEETAESGKIAFKNKWLMDWWRHYHASGN